MKILALALGLLLCQAQAFAENIRVNLVKDQGSVQLAADQAFTVKNVDSGKTFSFESGKYYLNVRSGYLYVDDKMLGDRIQILRKDGGSLPAVNQRRYAGILSVSSMSGELIVNNELDLELYLTAVLPGKSSPIMPDETIKAQAVAARSYAKYMKLLNRTKRWDIEASDRELPFTGIGAEKDVLTSFIQQTSGEYLLDRDNMPAMAVTTECSGGHTEDAADIFGVAYSYLQGVEDYDQDAPDYSWSYETTPVIVRNLLEQTGEYILGRLRNIYLSPLSEPGQDRTVNGRVRTVLINGEDGTARVDAGILVRQLDLKSALFDVSTGVPFPDKLETPLTNFYGMEIGRKEIPIDYGRERPRSWQGMSKSAHVLKGDKDEKVTFFGRGKGHGVGLSVWGARELANRKHSYAEILSYYYKNTRLSK